MSCRPAGCRPADLWPAMPAELTDSVTGGPEAVDSLPALAFVFSSVFKEPRLWAHAARLPWRQPLGVGAGPSVPVDRFRRRRDTLQTSDVSVNLRFRKPPPGGRPVFPCAAGRTARAGGRRRRARPRDRAGGRWPGRCPAGGGAGRRSWKWPAASSPAARRGSRRSPGATPTARDLAGDGSQRRRRRGDRVAAEQHVGRLGRRLGGGRAVDERGQLVGERPLGRAVRAVRRRERPAGPRSRPADGARTSGTAGRPRRRRAASSAGGTGTARSSPGRARPGRRSSSRASGPRPTSAAAMPARARRPGACGGSGRRPTRCCPTGPTRRSAARTPRWSCSHR